MRAPRTTSREGEHGVRYDLAHNMTVTPRNVDQVAEVVRAISTASGTVTRS
jgi:hypothetical protein